MNTSNDPALAFRNALQGWRKFQGSNTWSVAHPELPEPFVFRNVLESITAADMIDRASFLTLKHLDHFLPCEGWTAEIISTDVGTDA